MATDVPRFDNGKQQLCPPHLIETIRPFYHFEGQPASQPVAGGGAPSKADDDMFHAPIFWKCLSLHLQRTSTRTMATSRERERDLEKCQINTGKMGTPDLLKTLRWTTWAGLGLSLCS